MQTLNKKRLSHKIKIFVADKPALSKHFDLFEEPEEDISIYSAFTGSVHEVPTRNRHARTKITRS